MFLNLFTKNHRFFSLKEILKLSMGRPHKDLTFNFFLTVERFWLFAKVANPGKLTNKYAELDPRKYNLFLIEDMKEYERISYYKKDLIVHYDDILYDIDGDPIVRLFPLSEFNKLNLDFFDNYSTVIIDKKAEDILKDNDMLELIENLNKTHSVLSVDGNDLCGLLEDGELANKNKELASY